MFLRSAALPTTLLYRLQLSHSRTALGRTAIALTGSSAPSLHVSNYSHRTATHFSTKSNMPIDIESARQTAADEALRRHDTTTPAKKAMPAVDIEAAKQAAAVEAVKNHFPSNPRFVGIGSGTTIVYVVQAIKDLPNVDVSRTGFVPTGYQSKQLIINAGLVPIEFDALPDDAEIDIAFDGADEVDEDLNCIKGGGACLYQEKLVAMRAREFVCVADHRKLQKRLLSKWPTIPIEVEPKAARQVMHRLRVLGSRSQSGGGPFIREGLVTKAGPIKTDQDFYIIDAPFPYPLMITEDVKDTEEDQGHGFKGRWEVETLSKAITEINGVLGVGLFCGPTGPEAREAGVVGGQRPIACYFGMEDGTVTVRKARGKDPEIVSHYPPLEPTVSKTSS